MTTVTKPVTNPKDADATPRINIQEFCEEYYEDIFPIIMDKVCRDRRKDVHTRLDFGKGLRKRTREESHHSSTRAQTTKPERLKVQDRLRYGDRYVLDRLDSRDRSQGRSRPHRLDTSNQDCPKDREHFRSVGESYDDFFSHSYRDGNRSRHMKRRRDNESPLSSVSKSDSSDGSSRKTQMPNNVKTYDGIGDLEDYVKIFQAAAHVEWWAMPTWCHMFNSTLIRAARTMEEMMITTTAFIRGEAAAASKKKGHTSWKAHDQFKRQTSNKSQETSAVFSSASYHSRYRSTHQANHVSSRRGRMTAKIEYHARRTQYHVQAKNVGHMTDPSGFSYRNAGRKPTSRASGRNSTRAMDTLHGRLITCGWVENVCFQREKHGQVPGQSQKLGQRIHQFSIIQVPLSKNKKADALSKIASTSFAHLSKHVLVEVLKEKLIKEKEVTTVVKEDGPTWMSPIVEYLKEGTLPSDMKKARKLCIKARQYELIEGILLQAVVPYAMVKMCWTAPGGDARDMIRKCNDCQIHRPITRNPQQSLTPITAPRYGLLHEMDKVKSSGDNHWRSAVIPAKIGMPTYRTTAVDVVRGVTFRLGDFVYRSNDASHAVAGGKLGPK
nr:hypothetical protein [Tanacetum cinerariifolium]